MVKEEQKAEYLGSMLDKKAHTDKEIRRRIQMASYTWRKMGSFLKNRAMTVRNRIIAYDAVVRSKLLYGLESARLTTGLRSKLTAFQLKGLRQILRVEHPYVNRENINDRVIQMANERTQGEAGTNKKNRKIELIADIILDKSVKLIGHVLRANESDPMKQVTFFPDKANVKIPGLRRVGRPMSHWAGSVLDHIWQSWEGWKFSRGRCNKTFHPEDQQQCDTLWNMAKQRFF